MNRKSSTTWLIPITTHGLFYSACFALISDIGDLHMPWWVMISPLWLPYLITALVFVLIIVTTIISMIHNKFKY